MGKRNIARAIIVLIGLVVVFYFWGSSSNYFEKDYNKTVTFYKNPPKTDHDTLMVLTYNIGYLSGMTNNLPVERPESLYADNLKNAISLFNKLDPDFIGFQEIDFNAERSFSINQFRKIAMGAHYNYGAKAVNWDKKYVPFPYGLPSVNFGQVYSGQAILSKYPIVDNEREVLIKPENNPFYYNAFYLDRVAQIAKIKLNKTDLIIINVHLEAFDVPTREKQAITLLKIYRKYADDYPVLIIGDFNSTPPNASHPYEIEETIALILSEPGIKSAISDSLYLATETQQFTFNSRNPDIKIDYIFYNSARIKEIDARVVGEANEISDHLPLEMHFVLK